MIAREPCPDCGLLWEHKLGCSMYGMDDRASSIMFGYPVCQCCGLTAGLARTEVHQVKQRHREGDA